ncbi:hypothetical protein [Dehalobacter sp. TBBPA1]|uniref:hypothetical protein n=1 Tax=Dehalobacter sp. TBBPA1 TaxID=3235037 RepID=UPI0034A2815F
MIRKLRVSFIPFFLGLFLSVATMAYAGQASSPVTNFGMNYGGYIYNGYCTITTSPSFASASAIMSCTNGSASTGYMGVSAYMYNDAGTCVKYSPWAYNSSPQVMLTATSPYTSVKGTYYAGGSFRMYNGSGYLEEPCAYSPRQSN